MAIIKYRDHKGSFEESMKTQIDVSSIDEIKAHLNEFYNQFGHNIEEIKFEHVGMDNRNNWDTYYVLQRISGESNFTVAGMSNGNFENN